MTYTLFAAADVVALSRVQFALTIMFHYLFPPLTIGLGVVLVWLGFRYVRTGDPLYRQAQKFWTGIYALNFALGVATGIVMEFEFGTNWAVYSEFVGDVFGSALAAEGVFAFFLESGFLAVLVFGWNRVGPKMHFLSTCLVSLGSMFSAVWIVVANSWQQTPAGHHIVPVYRKGEPWVIDGEPVMRAEIVDFWAMVFNPSSVVRLAPCSPGRSSWAERWCAAWGRGTCSAARRVRPAEPDRRAGGAHRRGVHRRRHRPPERRVRVRVPFVSYRLMVGIGTFLMALTVAACYFRLRGTLFTKKWMLWLFVLTVVPAIVANHAGWVAAEVGRQPWIVQPSVTWTGEHRGEGDVVVGPDGLVRYDEGQGLRTTAAVSRAITEGQVLGSIIGFGAVYTLLGVVWLWVLHHKIKHGPDLPAPPPAPPNDLKGFLDAAAERPNYQASMTEAKEPVPPSAEGTS